jgi:hypothetical protein
MMTKKRSSAGAAAVAVAMLFAVAPVRLSAQQTTAEAVRAGDNDLGALSPVSMGRKRVCG